MTQIVTDVEMAQFRIDAESRMTGLCTIVRTTGQVLDPATDTYTPTTSTIYSGKCRVKVHFRPRQEEAGEVDVDVREYQVSIPFDSPTPVKRGDVHTTTASEDTWLVGVALTVVDPSYGSQTTARRLIVQATA